MKLETAITDLTNDTITFLGEGTSAVAYRSISNPAIVYLATHIDDLVRPLYHSIDRNKYKHIPRLDRLFDTKHVDYIDKFNRIDNRQYTVWSTDYNPIAYPNTEAAHINAVLEHEWFIFDRLYFYDRKNPLDNTKFYTIARMFIDYLYDNRLVPQSIIDTLNEIYIKALLQRPTFKFEFQCYNLGIDTATGELILRDSIVFTDMPIYQRWTFQAL